MSQLSQQTDGPSDLQIFPHDSPTIGRTQVVQYSPNNSSPIAESGRRYAKSIPILSYCDVHLLGPSLSSRSQRKAAPSPLQTSTTATSPPSSVTPTRTTFVRTGVDHTSSSTSSTYQNLQEGPRSPKERLDDLLASEKSFYKSEDSSTESIPEGKESRLVVPWENIICLPC